MSVLVINANLVNLLLRMGECIGALEEAFRSLVTEKSCNPLRPVMRLPGRDGLLGLMPAYLESAGVTGLKAVTVFPGNHGSELDSHQGAVLLFEAERGRLLSMVDASSITAIRTAAASALATRVLAREDASRLAILGSGIQATSHLAGMLEVRPIRQVTLWSRNPEHARAFARRESERHQIEIEVVDSAEKAVASADIICTTTASPTPILEGAWIHWGVHINAVGSSVPFTRELDDQAMQQSRLFVDRRESALNEAGDLLIPIKSGVLKAEHIQGELGEVLTNHCPGRQSASEITLFKSLGLGIEDLAAARLVYQKALETGVGTEVEWDARVD